MGILRLRGVDREVGDYKIQTPNLFDEANFSAEKVYYIKREIVVLLVEGGAGKKYTSAGGVNDGRILVALIIWKRLFNFLLSEFRLFLINWNGFLLLIERNMNKSTNIYLGSFIAARGKVRLVFSSVE